MRILMVFILAALVQGCAKEQSDQGSIQPPSPKGMHKHIITCTDPTPVSSTVEVRIYQETVKGIWNTGEFFLNGKLYATDLFTKFRTTDNKVEHFTGANSTVRIYLNQPQGGGTYSANTILIIPTNPGNSGARDLTCRYL